ncbi:MAG: hypothetical protein O3A77_03635 [bacterium]|nr:hypothetical protein [bacterium]
MTTSIVFISDNYLAISKLCYALRQHYTVSVQSTESIRNAQNPFAEFNCAIIDYTHGPIEIKTKPPIFTIGLVDDPDRQATIQLLQLTDLSLNSTTPIEHLCHYLQPAYHQLIQSALIPVQSSILFIGPFHTCLSQFTTQLLPFNCLHAPTALAGISLWRNPAKNIRLVLIDQAIDDAIIHHEIQLSCTTILMYGSRPTPPSAQYFNRGYHGIIAHPNDLIAELIDIASIPKPIVSSQQNATFIMEDIHHKRTQKLAQDYQRLPTIYQEKISRSTAISRINATTFKDTLATLCHDAGQPQPSYKPQPVLLIGTALTPVMQSLKPHVFAPYLVPTIEAAMHAIQMTDFSAIVTPIMLPDGMIQNWLVPIYEHLFIRNVVSKTIVISHDHQLKTITQLMRRHVNHRLLDPVDPHELVRILEPWALEFFYIQSCYTVLNALRKNHCNQSLKSALNHHLDPELISLL